MNIRAKFPLLVLLVSITTLLNAQVSPADPAGIASPKSESGVKQPEQDLAKTLNLSKEQNEQFKKIDYDYHAKAKAVKEAKKAELNRIREERNAAHKAILNAEQARKYDEVMAKRQEEKQARKAARKAEHKAEKKASKAKNPKSANGQE